MASKDWVSAEKQDKNSDQIDVPNLSFGNKSYTKLSFGDLYDIKNGINKSKEYFGKGNKILNYMDVNKSVKNDENSIKGLIQISDEEYERYNVQNNDLFFTRTSETSEEIGLTSAYIGNSEKCIFSGFILRARPIKEFINSLYFAYYLRSPKMRNEIIKLSSITTRALISGKNLSTLNVKIPDINEQEKVANFLSLVDKKIELMERKRNTLYTYKKSVMQQIFSKKIKFNIEKNSNCCCEKKLGDICEITTGKLDANAMCINGKYRFYTCSETYYYIDNYEFDDDALLISGNGAHVGYIHHYKGKFNAYQRTYVLLRFNEDIMYVYYFLEKFLKRRIEQEKNIGNTPYITLNTLKNMVIQVPSLNGQKKIADFLSKIDNKLDSVEQQLEKIKEFKKYLLQQMFV